MQYHGVTLYQATSLTTILMTTKLDLDPSSVTLSHSKDVTAMPIPSQLFPFLYDMATTDPTLILSGRLLNESTNPSYGTMFDKQRKVEQFFRGYNVSGSSIYGKYFMMLRYPAIDEGATTGGVGTITLTGFGGTYGANELIEYYYLIGSNGVDYRITANGASGGGSMSVTVVQYNSSGGDTTPTVPAGTYAIVPADFTWRNLAALPSSAKKRVVTVDRCSFTIAGGEVQDIKYTINLKMTGGDAEYIRIAP